MLHRLGSGLLAASALGGALHAGIAGAQTDAQFKCQAGTSRAGQKFIGAKTKCVVKCESAARKGSAPFSDCEPPYRGSTLACIADPLKGTEAKALAAVVKACTKTPLDCPTCFSGGDCSAPGHGVATVARLERLVDQFVPAVACLDTADAEHGKCIDGTFKALSKLFASRTRCYDKCYAGERKGAVAPLSCGPPPTDPFTVSCTSGAETKAVASIDKVCFVAPAEAPACYDGAVHPPAIIPSPGTAPGWAALVESAVDTNIVPGTYCSSPSGAFVD